ncbi:MAG: hypothetical protein R3C68_02305 [Myxococcota bacterium]
MRLANISSTHVDNTMFAKLIGSVCHEVGNHLVAMRLHAHLLEDEEKDAEPMTNVAMLSARAIRLLRQVQQLSLTRCGGDRPVARHSINILKEHIHTLETGSQRIQLNVADDLLEGEIVTDSLLGQIIELLTCFMENSVHEQLQVVIEKTERSPSFRIEARFQNDKKLCERFIEGA